jgi:hypothetical protein
MSPDIFNLVEMDTPAGVRAGTAFTVKVKINADPASPVYSTWQFFRDGNGGAATFDIDLFAESIGPGVERKLTTTSHSEPLVSGQDDYDITLSPSFPAGARKGVYELAAVITLMVGGNAVGWSAYAADAIIQVT